MKDQTTSVAAFEEKASASSPTLSTISQRPLSLTLSAESSTDEAPLASPEATSRASPEEIGQHSRSLPKDPLARGRSATLDRIIRGGQTALAILEEIERAEIQEPLLSAGRRASKRPANEPAFLLHVHPWSESSLVVEALSARFGRVFLIARGAKRPGSNLRGILVPFTPLRLSWTGRGETKVLTKADWLGVLPPLEGDALLSGFYVNELVLRLTSREDPHPGLFTSYVRVMEALCEASSVERQCGLRRFEAELLQLCGWGVAIDEEAAQTHAGNIDAWRLSPEGALIPAAYAMEGMTRPEESGYTWSGAAVRDVLEGRLENTEALRTAREIYREAIELHLDGRPLRSRRVLAELKRL